MRTVKKRTVVLALACLLVVFGAVALAVVRTRVPDCVVDCDIYRWTCKVTSTGDSGVCVDRIESATVSTVRFECWGQIDMRVDKQSIDPSRLKSGDCVTVAAVGSPPRIEAVVPCPDS